MTIWGTGTPKREFLHVDDCADALLFLMKNYSDSGHINVGSGTDLTIDELARLVMQVVGFKGDLVHDTARPDGTPRKLMSNAKLAAMGWSPAIPLEQGLAQTYRWFLEQEQVRD
jgi:GDP-L-fucose synthase